MRMTLFAGIVSMQTGEPLNGRPEPERGAQDCVERGVTRQRVLVVDDQHLIADSLAEIFENAGFSAAVAYDGWEALQLAARFHPDCLISDVLMPRMNGVELAITIRNHYPATTILLFSGQAGISEILQDGHRRGYEFELIPKPIHPLKLIERLKAR
jgi:CheY-like chemotaxis protein